MKRKKVKNYFKEWNYTKHFAVVSAIYTVFYAIDLTLGYVVAKKLSKRLEGIDE